MNKFANELIEYLLNNNYDDESFSTVVRKVVELTAEAAIGQIAAIEGKIPAHEYKQVIKDYFSLK